MARKSKRMAFNDAIRQGQAKIAEGLKTGQLRSDGPSAHRAGEDKGDLSSPGSAVQNPVEKSRAFFLKSKEKPMIWGQFSPKTRLIALSSAASIVLLVLGIWLISLTGEDQSPNPESQGASGANIVSEENVQDEKPGLERGDSSKEVDSSGIEKGSLTPAARGDNVIWIQSIQVSRKDELRPLRDFFRSKGIETEIAEMSSSNLAVLMTRDGFERNPSVVGTEGHLLLERIKQIGLVYVEETEDTRFGSKPFQDALGYKR